MIILSLQHSRWIHLKEMPSKSDDRAEGSQSWRRPIPVSPIPARKQNHQPPRQPRALCRERAAVCLTQAVDQSRTIVPHAVATTPLV